jgi:hypothetical protein
MMNLTSKYRTLYSKAVHAAMLLRDKRVKQHVVVFESDDWGSVRMPSLESFHRMQSKGIRMVSPASYDRVDTLASNDDLEMLMDVLASVNDSKGNPAKITLNCCVANPDFDKIRASDFKEYHYELFTETLKRYPHHNRSFELWKEGIAHKLFQPQFHGREHLNAQKWLRYLRAGDKDTHEAFNEGCYSLCVTGKNGLNSYLEAFGIESSNDCAFVKQSIREGLDFFEQLFGFHSDSIIAPCYIWDDYIEEESAACGVKLVQGGYIQRHSPWQRSKGNRITGHFSGEINRLGQCYAVRNCSFEPSQIDAYNADYCMNGIDKAFERHVPAVVSCHRLNFIGELDTLNRDKNLKDFQKLLRMIVEKYPDVEFLSSDELIKIMQ